VASNIGIVTVAQLDLYAHDDVMKLPSAHSYRSTDSKNPKCDGEPVQSHKYDSLSSGYRPYVATTITTFTVNNDLIITFPTKRRCITVLPCFGGIVI